MDVYGIYFRGGFMVISVHKSKKNQLHKANKGFISLLSSSTCPAKLLKKYLRAFHMASI